MEQVPVAAIKIGPNVYSLPVPMDGEYFIRHYPPMVYLVVDREEAAMIDSGYGDDRSVRARLAQLEKLGSSKVDYIIVTHIHEDHAGGAEKLSQATGAKILLHQDDVEVTPELWKKARVDNVLKDGDMVNIGGTELEVVHTPGHTPGHVCVLRRGDKALFTGDHILGSGTTAVSPDRGDMAQYIESLHKLQRMEIGKIYPGHGDPIGHPQDKISYLIAHRREREEQILELLKKGMSTVDEMAKSIYTDVDPGLMESARGQVKVHLIKLEREDKVATRDGGLSYVKV